MTDTHLFDFDAPVDRTGSASLKWDRYKGRDIIPLWVADMDFKSPPAVLNALHERIDHGVFGYTLPPDDLVQTIINRLQTLYDWKVEKEWIVWLPGLVTGLNIACRAVGSSGDEVITPIPVYPPFLSAPEMAGKTRVTIPLENENGRMTIDFDRLQQTISARTRLFILCNPHNPGGTVFTQTELKKLGDICETNNITICSDEIHCDLILDEDKKHTPIASLSGSFAKRTITLMAPSKTWNIPGLGCSFAVIPDKSLRKSFVSVAEGIVPHVNTLGYTAALAAYRNGGDWLESLLSYLGANRDLVSDRINRMKGLSMNHLEATYLAWIDTRNTGITEPGKFFEKAGVGLIDGKYFMGDGFLRLNFACTRSLLEKALDRMESAIEQCRTSY